MNIIWIVNIVFPELYSLMGKECALKGTGGWLTQSSEYLAKQPNIKLCVVTVSNTVSKLECYTGENILYYILPFGSRLRGGNMHETSQYDKFFHYIHDTFKPDLVHIHGTEFSHGLSYLKLYPSTNVVVSIQGVLAECANYYLSGISPMDVLYNTTLYDIIRGGLFYQKRAFKKRSKYERKIIKLSKHIIGRTSWDESIVKSINPRVSYYHCDEILRPEFYSGEWSYNNCKKHSIFISQGGYPIKGLHQLLKALPFILDKYPDTELRIGGNNLLHRNGLTGWLVQTGYSKYIRRLIIKYGLKEHIVFTGPLTAAEMKQEYMNSNVFVCPSSIENSPNSLCEAQILGVPHIAAFVGGIPDFMHNNCEGLYRFEDIRILASKIINVFDKAGSISNTGIIKESKLRHNRKYNTEQLITIYHLICDKE